MCPSARSSAALFRTIKPKKFNKKIFKEEMKVGANEVADLMLKDFEKTTRTWTHKVVFRRRVSIGTPIKIRIETYDKVFKWVNDGTKSHIIKPRKKSGVLAFPAKTVPKTTPRLISSRKGFKSKKTVFVKGPVKVRGITPRKFTIVIREKNRKKFKEIMQKSLNRAARKSGHSLRKI